MLVVKLLGGLGNQMFQYAFGRALALRTGKAVKFDTADLLDRSPSLTYTFREYELDVFNARPVLAAAADTRLFSPPIGGLAYRVAHKINRRLVQAQRFVEKQSFGYDETVFQCGNATYFDGYWQNEAYFKPYEKQIRQDLTLQNPLSGLNLEIATQIGQAPQAVSLHVRRGDYVSNAQANAVHGVCSPAYYEQAVAMLQAQLGEISLFIFSDEPAWVQANMKFDAAAVYISHNTGKNSVEDLRLMSLCKHNIIANSSFSWWGAWLNSNPQKIVIAPKNWILLGTTMSTGPVPASWVTL